MPGHQNSGAPAFFGGVFLMVYSHSCWQYSNKNRKCREHINTLGKKDKLIFLKPIFEIKTKNLLSTWKGTRVLVPGHQNSGALSSWQQVFCFNLKNGLQEYQFVFFPKCIYVFPTFPVFIGILPAWMRVHHQENPPKKCGGTRVLVPGHQNSGAPYVPDCLDNLTLYLGHF